MNVTIKLPANTINGLKFSHLLHLFVLISVIIVSLDVRLVLATNCVADKCQCVWRTGKYTADCSLRKLTLLPQDKNSEEIQIMNLTRNSFYELKTNVFIQSYLNNLQKIYLQQVGLEKVDDKAFNGLKNVIELDLSVNSLKYIPSQSLSSMTKLRTLDMSSNLIPFVNKHSFHNLTDLKTLSLERNRITFIDDMAFDGLINLSYLKLSQNQLTTMRSQILDPLTQLHSLTLSDNKWQCDCTLRSFRKYLLSTTRITVIDEPKCYDTIHSNYIDKWNQLGLSWFLCAPVISNYSGVSSNVNVNEGSTLELECGIVLTDDDDQQLSIQWYWNTIPITNNSKGCGEDCQIKSNQQFLINENQSVKVNNQNLRVSRLQLSSVQSFNSGKYICIADNRAGKAEKPFTVSVTALGSRNGVTAAAAASESHFGNESTDPNKPVSEIATDNIVVGLILGILVGVMFVLILFGISVILLCRRRQRRYHNSNQETDNISEGTELEKLTPNSNNSTLRVNPIQKPPRMALNNYNSDYLSEKEMPEVWLMKHHNNNGHHNNTINSHNQSYAESDYSTTLLVNDNHYEPIDMIQPYAESVSTVITEPDLINPSVYVRDRPFQETDLDDIISINSQGTEV
ncbi:immunoglobulin superfamily containing leucine-rich repeat protein-like [Oppia nitens]|uniref:immunoglobulin superfamily containing leucine-rich repeat protein-like n=1 Tax=Oppia nitens TaxID=1686743 RepID=UPI0023DC4050|nr:immunoglobulin superfamily containing leucine-rich repeat protein-like [Oppia nitens]